MNVTDFVNLDVGKDNSDFAQMIRKSEGTTVVGRYVLRWFNTFYSINRAMVKIFALVYLDVRNVLSFSSSWYHVFSLFSRGGWNPL